MIQQREVLIAALGLPEHEETERADFIIEKLDAAGFVIVPKVPTPRMIAEGESAASFGIGKPTADDAILKVWEWMLNAAHS